METIKINFDYSKYNTEFLEIQKKINEIIMQCNHFDRCLQNESTEEYIRLLGYDFRSLSYHTSGKYQAKAGKHSKYPNRLYDGKTPFEAIKKLYIGLTTEFNNLF